ncbi:hypothetical protein [Pseudomonas syringae]|nr:hypothetical protein [Pseudomonas syringae]
MKRGGIFKECIAGADILLDSAEIEHVIGLLQEDSQSIRENLLDEACALRLSKTGPAALVAKRLRRAIINCFGDTPRWPMDTLEDIEATAQRYSRFFHGACLTDALRLAHLAEFRGLDEVELWQLRARLEQITSMALFDMPGAPAASALLKAREQGAVERAKKVASSGGKGKAEKLFGHFKRPALDGLASRAYGLDGKKLKKAAVARALLRNELSEVVDQLKRSQSELNKALPTPTTVEKWIADAYEALPTNTPSA